MGGAFYRKCLVFMVVAAFMLVSAVAFAQEKQKKWVVIKDSKGVCKVIESKKGKTDKTIAGPFATKDEAVKAKEKECPKPAKKQPSAKDPSKKQQ